MWTAALIHVPHFKNFRAMKGSCSCRCGSFTRDIWSEPSPPRKDPKIHSLRESHRGSAILSTLQHRFELQVETSLSNSSHNHEIKERKRKPRGTLTISKSLNASRGLCLASNCPTPPPLTSTSAHTPTSCGTPVPPLAASANSTRSSSTPPSFAAAPALVTTTLWPLPPPSGAPISAPRPTATDPLSHDTRHSMANGCVVPKDTETCPAAPLDRRTMASSVSTGGRCGWSCDVKAARVVGWVGGDAEASRRRVAATKWTPPSSRKPPWKDGVLRQDVSVLGGESQRVWGRRGWRRFRLRWYLEPSAMRSWILALKLSTRPSVATCAAACWIGDMKRKFSATPQLTALGSTAPLRSYHSSRARAEAMSGAMGFSDSTCLPAASAALI